MKNSKGITLIALVITIIVLLILAGVAIAMLTGDNGLLNKSTRAAVKSKIAEEKEQAMLDYNAAKEAWYEGKYAPKKEEDRITEDFVTWINIGSVAGTYFNSDDKYTVQVTANGENPILIMLNTKYIDPEPDGDTVIGTIEDDNGIKWSDEEPAE